jgi:hypothetical protein
MLVALIKGLRARARTEGLRPVQRRGQSIAF